MKQRYIRKETYGIEEVLAQSVPSNTRANLCRVDWDGDLIKMNSQRYEVFKHKGTTCVACGLKGVFFAKERDQATPTYHFNLYAVNEQGEDVLMTKDHIVPRSLSGPDRLENYQPMCTDCNREKGIDIVAY